MNWDKLRHELLLENSEQDVIITHEQHVNDIASFSLFFSLPYQRLQCQNGFMIDCNILDI